MAEIGLGAALAAIGAGVAIGFAGLVTRDSGYLRFLDSYFIISVLRIIKWTSNQLNS